MSETITDVQGIFSSIATKYDKLNAILTLNIDKLWRKKAVKLCNIKENDKVLDLCCGTGKMIELECRAVGESTMVVGLDFNKEMINVGYKKLNKSLSSYKFNLIQGDATELPFEDNSFHCITIAFGLRNVPNKIKAISEMYRVLKPGGKVVCLELSKPKMPVFRNVYNLYFNFVLPVIGYLGTQDKAAYNYLRDSVNDFMTKKQLRHEFENVGFENSGFKSLTCGIASIHYGIKPL
ncbi:bifunctional demethylmenaquinone methyltransferase/2-methoxy-6-polyprenyl-1,4-benzoquinol methylase UbiE [Clostridium estertheticum]|uniref:bifunctional demethylmenaquinone methyltransferase/2-methoxy-6-polyprenyl-1,4-benzoquinol methylase UbiE n=1 Tax=Clostridium estertheticum TaxID=238834 RepID=UPI001C7DE39B|nr:bifunctional demethylmenaquinone methyltransferase/2-methoxy-6-polyprenyl-1,4-benzoquinol methylase UbiE [Clostridium estertheticum]MBX4264835.1 bifunctional demethylmenaquinone methyltransferase/2-methoxy-6-polyprenyl-1,4-benzoquinol methylase UbiE [Clostridium estertheticum]MBX4270941.1 bifunctional demethylmenaquinone methyltransferase/2-methoxy-6-polyprenyl-1,4-benzoquinol methylase UbiE [Clostridium estertheticum]MCB2361270.1 bifunctional demethylmenaquinone methyltransferase/2-methoxy-6